MGVQVGSVGKPLFLGGWSSLSLSAREEWRKTTQACVSAAPIDAKTSSDAGVLGSPQASERSPAHHVATNVRLIRLYPSPSLDLAEGPLISRTAAREAGLGAST